MNNERLPTRLSRINTTASSGASGAVRQVDKRDSSNDEFDVNQTDEFAAEKITKEFLFSTIVAALGPGFQHGYYLGITNTPHKRPYKYTRVEHLITARILHEKPPTFSPTLVIQIVTESPNMHIHILVEWIGNENKSQHHNLPLNQTSQIDYESLEEDTFIISMMISVYSLGGILGGLFIYFWNRNIGFRKIFLCCNGLATIASFLVGFSKCRKSLTMLVLGRFLMGMNNGFCSGIVIIYLAEISPTKIRGTICSIYELFITVSILVSQFINFDIGFGSLKTWPPTFFLPTAVALSQFFFLPFCSDPPFYLYEIGKISEAKAAIRKLYGAEFEEIKFATLALKVHYQMRIGKPRLGDLFSRMKYQTPLVISCVMMFAQQITGISVIISYTTVALYVINLRHIPPAVILTIGIVNVCVTIVSLNVVDSIGRRWLLIFAFATMFLDMLALYTWSVLGQYFQWRLISLMSVIFMIMYVAFFASGAGSIPWFLYAEFFLDNMRPLAASIVVPVNWLTHFVISAPFLSLHNKLGPSIFFIFAVMDFVLLVYIVRNVPETNNQPVAAIMTQFSPDRQHSSLQMTNMRGVDTLGPRGTGQL